MSGTQTGGGRAPRSWVGYVATLVVFLVVDGIWLAFVASGLFRDAVGDLLRATPYLPAVVAFYVIYPVGLFVLAVRPAIAAGSGMMAATHGSMVGLTAYAAFDLTNLAIIAGWPVWLAVLDMAWGTLVSALAAVAGFVIGANRRPAASMTR
jgi:uncharacterized membrane protein